jgi:hypothetical protein
MFRRLVALAIALMGTPALAAETVGGERAFSFVALGDMPYKLPDDIAKFDRSDCRREQAETGILHPCR